jgi:hypothetical protein
LQVIPPATGVVGKVEVVAPEPYNTKQLIYPIPHVYSSSSVLRPPFFLAALGSFFFSSS